MAFTDLSVLFGPSFSARCEAGTRLQVQSPKNLGRQLHQTRRSAMFDFSYRIGCAFCVGAGKTDFSDRVRSILMHTGQDLRCSAIATWIASTSAGNSMPARTLAMSAVCNRL
jgi:hypothetical protein